MNIKSTSTDLRFSDPKVTVTCEIDIWSGLRAALKQLNHLNKVLRIHCSHLKREGGGEKIHMFL